MQFIFKLVLFSIFTFSCVKGFKGANSLASTITLGYKIVKSLGKQTSKNVFSKKLKIKKKNGSNNHPKRSFPLKLIKAFQMGDFQILFSKPSFL